jgi:serine/threonine-protein kinase
MTEKSPMDQSIIGRELSDGRYVIERLIGAGGMGAVYLGQQRAIKRKVAIKVIQGDLSKAPALRARFHREAQSLAALQNPHCVTIHDFGETEEGLLYLVMEHLVGRTLAALLARDGRLTIPLFMDITGQICSAIHAAHSAGLVHRDLKPDNIFIQDTSDGPRVKVLDFGLVKILEGPGDSGEDVSITRPGQVFGTPLYMSPEQALGQIVDHRADIYALGLIAYECLTGQPAFSEPTPQQVLMAHATKTPPRLDYLRNDVPEHITAAVNICLAKSADDRFGSVTGFSAALEAPAGDSTEAPTMQSVTVSVSGGLDSAHSPPLASALPSDPETAPAAPRKLPLGLAIGGLLIVVAAALYLSGAFTDGQNAGVAETESVQPCGGESSPAFGPSGEACLDADTLYLWSFEQGTNGRSGQARPTACRAKSPNAVSLNRRPGPFGKAAAFTGESESRLECDASGDLRAPFTVETWVYPRSTPKRGCHQALLTTATIRGGASIFRCANPRVTQGWLLSIIRRDDTHFGVEFRYPPKVLNSRRASTPTLASTARIPQDEWSHVAIINDGRDLTILVNGRSTTGPSPPLSSPRHGSTLTMGGHIAGVDGVLAADLANVRISSVARDPNTIKRAYARAMAR